MQTLAGHSYIGRTDILMGRSSARDWNPFPWQYRSDCVRESAITCLKNFPPNPAWPPFPDGDALLQTLMEQAPGPRHLPLHPIMTLLQKSPQLNAGHEQIIWMGGATNVPGNLDPTTVPTPPPGTMRRVERLLGRHVRRLGLQNTTCPSSTSPST